MDLEIAQAHESKDEVEIFEHNDWHIGFGVVISPLLGKPFCYPVRLVSINLSIRLDLELEDKLALDNVLVAWLQYENPHVASQNVVGVKYLTEVI